MKRKSSCQLSEKGNVRMRIKLFEKVSLFQITSLLHTEPLSENKVIEYVTTDSREVRKGDLFLSLCKDEEKKEEYEKEVEIKGGIILTSLRKEGAIVVDNMEKSLLSLSHFFLNSLPCLSHRIAITGSVGKTTTKEFLAKILSKRYKIHYTYKNYNNSLGLLLTVLAAPYETEAIILELGTNHRGEIASLSQAISPTLSAITRIGTSHIGNFGSIEELIKEKTDIISGMSIPCLVCDPKGAVKSLARTITASCENVEADIYLRPILEEIDGTRFDLYLKGDLIDTLDINIGGRHVLHCLGIAIALATEIGCGIDEIRAGIWEITEETARHKIIKIDDYYILDDSYNSSLESIEGALSLIKNHSGGISALLGDIYELGEMTEQIHKKIGAMAHSYGIDKLYLFGTYSKYISEGAGSSGMSAANIFTNLNLDEPELTAKQIRDHHKKGELILLKASNKVKLCRVIDILMRK